MQIFCPYPSPLECAKALWNDRLRYNKQTIECKQILDAIDGVGKGWFNHPVIKTYKEHREWLVYYLNCFECYRVYKKEEGNTSASYLTQAVLWSKKADSISPPFLTQEFCDQHKRRLFCKSEHLYPQFAKYGKSDINYYFVDGELLKYKNGKRIKE